jgi:hypothetical protein
MKKQKLMMFLIWSTGLLVELAALRGLFYSVPNSVRLIVVSLAGILALILYGWLTALLWEVCKDINNGPRNGKSVQKEG